MMLRSETDDLAAQFRIFEATPMASNAACWPGSSGAGLQQQSAGR